LEQQRMGNLSRTLRRAIQVNGEGVATDCGDRRRTWRELGDRVARIAGGLRRLGVGDGDRVAILSLNSDRYFEAYFAIAWAGGVFVPVNTRLAGPELAHWLGDSGSAVLLVDDAFAHVPEELADRLPDLGRVVHIGDGPPRGSAVAWEELAGSTPAPDAGRGGEDLAGIFYTGGTTGRSKGVMLQHRSLSINPLQVLPEMGVARGAVVLHVAPMFHVGEGFFSMLSATVAGESVFLPAFDPGAVLHAIEAKRVNWAFLVPTMINMVVHHPEAETRDLSSLHGMFYGASPMPEAVIERALELMPHTRFHQAYGQTESSPVITMLGPEHHVPGGAKLRSAGQAVPGVDLAILDPDGREVGCGQIGEICARGDNIMQGYWNLPDATARTLRGGWLHTEDAGLVDEEGFLFIVDRLKDMIISGGENVYSSEVENALYQHPAVAECAVIGIPHDTWGEQVHAIVRLEPDQQVDADTLIEWCHGLIAGFKCPRSVEFREVPLPVSGAGKVLKRELREPYWSGQARAVH
jgi:long-chain acyl-CoA synthetase